MDHEHAMDGVDTGYGMFFYFYRTYAYNHGDLAGTASHGSQQGVPAYGHHPGGPSVYRAFGERIYSPSLDRAGFGSSVYCHTYFFLLFRVRSLEGVEHAPLKYPDCLIPCGDDG